MGARKNKPRRNKMDYECLLYDVAEGIATLTLNRPERLNALGGSLRSDLYHAVLRASDDPDVRVMIITGAGRGFCSGGDVKAMRAIDEGGADAGLLGKIAPERDKVVLAMRDSPKPIIAAVNGPAAGAGMNLALACDMRIASENANFAQAFVRRGLHVDWGGTYFLPRIVGMAKACELIFTGDSVDAEEALALGIVSKLVSPDELMTSARAMATKIASGPPIAIRMAKRSLYHNLDCDLRQSLEQETYSQVVCRETDDAKEGILAFTEKRTPKFTGR
jgi:enoyl-CoA hydratase/carnithine racemase